ncbi:MerR family transcriptional regulator [Gordonia liuliyuniae]|uniref:MerR family transcriptional regulator n=1 Tax=Gordonia liuliyuniae TaxID=2911517 RepID=A0ABS9IQG3_9ACTN|nr:MerR family transcriptional regulator [Gordonia liuliyuniae]MCF8587770.1 MerR family transcriptional regulator [Gordonia liuliyuniae]
MTEYRIDDLARESGTTTRNIRGYQERGLLPMPLRRGRVAIYTERHLANLRAINDLLGKGFNLKHIATFLTNPRARVGEALELPDVLGEHWSREPRRRMTTREVAAKLGSADDATIDQLVRAGIVRRIDGTTDVEAVDARIVDNLATLIDRGMPFEAVVRTHAEFTEKLSDAVRVLMRAGHDEFIRREGVGWVPRTPDELAWVTDLLAAMRQAATDNAYTALDRALDAALDEQLREYEETAHRPIRP